jgi:hypothetical protein
LHINWAVWDLTQVDLADAADVAGAADSESPAGCNGVSVVRKQMLKVIAAQAEESSIRQVSNAYARGATSA